MRRVLFLIVLIITIICFAQSKAEITPKTAADVKTEPVQDSLPPSKARIELDRLEFDFGFAPQGNAKLVHNFTITNVGKDTLEITRVRPTCGCTAAPLKKKLLAPKEQTEVSVIFRTRGYKRKTAKSVRIESTDPTKPSLSVRFSTNLDTAAWTDTTKGPRIKSEPAIIDMGKGDLYQKKTTIDIINMVGQKLDIEVIDYTNEVIKEPDLKKTKLSGNKSTTLKVEMLSDYDIKNVIQASITIAAYDKSGSEVTRFTIPIIGCGP